MSDPCSRARREIRSRPIIEWAVGVLSAILLLLLLGFLLVEGLMHEPGGPHLRARIASVQEENGMSLIRIEVANSADTAASAVHVVAEAGGSQIGAIEFDYVAGNALRHGSFQLPGTALPEIRVRVTGFTLP